MESFQESADHDWKILFPYIMMRTLFLLLSEEARRKRLLVAMSRNVRKIRILIKKKKAYGFEPPGTHVKLGSNLEARSERYKKRMYENYLFQNLNY